MAPLYTRIEGVSRDLNRIDSVSEGITKSLDSMYIYADGVSKSIYESEFIKQIDHVELWLEGRCYWRTTYKADNDSSTTYGDINYTTKASDYVGKVIINDGNIIDDKLKVRSLNPYTVAIGGHFYAILKNGKAVRFMTIDNSFTDFKIRGNHKKSMNGSIHYPQSWGGNAYGLIATSPTVYPSAFTNITNTTASSTPIAPFGPIGGFVMNKDNLDVLEFYVRTVNYNLSGMEFTVSDLIVTYMGVDFPLTVVNKFT